NIDAAAWKWRFGNGDSATQARSNARYADPGIYSVWLQTTHNDGSKDTLQHILRLGIAEAVTFDIDNNKGRYPNDIQAQFQANAPGATSFAWDFGDGSKSLEENPSHTYTRVGKYTVKLVAGYPNGSTDRAVMKSAVQLAPIITNDAVVFGILMLVLGLVFWTSSLQTTFWKRLYTFVPALLLCYFIPAILNWPLNLIHGEFSSLYNPMASRYLLPASLVLLTLSVDYTGLVKLGPKALIMFLTATIGIVIGGPIALWAVTRFQPELLETAIGDSELWEGLATIAGSWIGGGANQTAMKEIFEVQETLFASTIVVDILVGNVWMAFLLIGAGQAVRIDRWLKADASAIESLKERVMAFQKKVARVPSATDFMLMGAVGFGAVALSHFGADNITPWMVERAPALAEMNLHSLTKGFFWIVVIATTLGLLLALTPLRKLEGAGASKIGTVFIYILIATIGMKMNILDAINSPGLFLIGALWMLVHIVTLLLVAKLIKAPFFFVAVGSQANVGGAASAPVVASAFSPVLAPVGVVLAVLGYALGTYGAILCAQLMASVH
ncbi:MAG: DUF819 family protein, partial [Bacteroidia bacterium]